MSTRRIGRHAFETSHEAKVLFPGDGITKGELMDYYEGVAPWILRWVRDRPLVLQRFPDGIREDGFYQKQVPDHFPGWITTVRVRKSDGGGQRLVVCDETATLVYLAQQGCLTLHPWLSRTGRLHHPDRLVIDVDPPGDDFAPVREAARACRDLLDELGLPSFLQTTGSTGVHVCVPLDRGADFDTVRGFAREIAAVLASRRPRELTTEIRKKRRAGRVFLDVARNAYAQTAVAPYAVRPLPGAPVATPIDWRELSRVEARTYTVRNIRRRLGQREDPWKGMARHAHGLARARRRLARIREREG